jgi:hypothetical protein
MVGYRADGGKSASETPSSPSTRVQIETDETPPSSGEVQERAVPHVKQGVVPLQPIAAGPPQALPGQFVIRTMVKQTFLTAVGGGGKTTDVFHTDATGIGGWERFKLIAIDPGNHQYAIQTASGNYVTAVNGGGAPSNALHTDATQIRSWETFRLGLDLPFWNVIQAINGTYLTAVGGGGKVADALHSDATQVGNWERFRLWKCGDLGSGFQYAIHAPSGIWFAWGGGNRLAPAIGVLTDYNNRPIPFDDNWERLRFFQQADGTYALQTLDGHYVTAVNGGGLAHGTTVADNLQTNRPQVQAWEKFRVVDLGDCSYTMQTSNGYYLGPWSGSHTEYGAFSTNVTNINQATRFRLVMFF